jgi:hypothetical protein
MSFQYQDLRGVHFNPALCLPFIRLGMSGSKGVFTIHYCSFFALRAKKRTTKEEKVPLRLTTSRATA